jgi:predicted metal-binding membrane protein
MAGSSVLETVLRRDRLVTLIALALASVAAWAYVAFGIGTAMPGTAMDPAMTAMPGMAMAPAVMAMPAPMPWTGAYFALIVAMWAVMMVAMMLPGAAPMVLTFAALQRHRRQAAPQAATALFTLGYLAIWAGFSILAATLQWRLDSLALLSPAMATADTVLAGGALMAAGAYQFTPLKQGCLVRCRSPVEFLTRYHRSKPFGLGLRHGLFCLGCCWAMMLLLFVGGVMNLAWVGAITLFVLLEKTVPAGRWLGHVAGIGLILWGGWMALAGL